MSVHFTIDNHVARVTLDRQDRLNAMDDETELELIGIWDQIERNRDIRVVVLTGAGDRAFCAGHDLKQTTTRTGLEYWAMARAGGYGGITLRDTLDVPVIARVNGFALGGGMVLTLGCDIVVASSNARFGLPEPRVGRLPLAGGIPQLLRRVPYLHAMDLMLTGRQIDANEAARIGLINEVVAPENLDATVDRWVADILACAPLAGRAIKQMMRANERMSSKDAEMLRLPALVEMLQSEDAKEGPLAFREKRAPQWTGK